MANLIIDIGNVAVKAAWAEGTALGKCYRYQGEKIAGFIQGLTAREKPSVMVVASTRETPAGLLAALEGCCRRLVVLDGRTDFPMFPMIRVTGPARAAAMIAARRLFSESRVIVFDFGSAVSIDMTERDGSYAGGRLSPGLRTRYKALNRYCGSLPLLGNGDSFQGDGMTVEDAIHSGVNSGIIFEIEGYLRRYPESVAVFTGGDAFYFAKRIKTPIFVVCNLVLMGLAIIADHYEKDETE